MNMDERARPRLQEFDVIMLPRKKSIGTASVEDYRRERVLAVDPLAARADPAVRAHRRSYVVGVVKPGEELPEQVAARHRHLESLVGDEERHDPRERAWPSFPV
jgi:hypothetical protein